MVIPSAELIFTIELLTKDTLEAASYIEKDINKFYNKGKGSYFVFPIVNFPCMCNI